MLKSAKVFSQSTEIAKGVVAMADTYITKDEFEKYQEVQFSGVTNMFDVRFVSELTGISHDKIIYIMKHYKEINEQYH